MAAYQASSHVCLYAPFAFQLPSTVLSLLMVCVYHAAKQKNLVKHGGDWKYSS